MVQRDKQGNVKWEQVRWEIIWLERREYRSEEDWGDDSCCPTTHTPHQTQTHHWLCSLSPAGVVNTGGIMRRIFQLNSNLHPCPNSSPPYLLHLPENPFSLNPPHHHLNRPLPFLSLMRWQGEGSTDKCPSPAALSWLNHILPVRRKESRCKLYYVQGNDHHYISIQ